jgi:hypothetical protein
MLRTAFPDLHFTIEELIAEGDTVAGRLTMNGTHDGPLMSMPPTGRPVRQDHMHFVRFRDGKAIEHWGVRDDMGMMASLGWPLNQPARPSEETSGEICRTGRFSTSRSVHLRIQTHTCG